MLACWIALSLLSGSGPAGGGPGGDPERWRFELVPYLWFASLDGTLELEPLPAARIDASLAEPLVNLDFALAEAFAARKGPWVVLADFTFTKLGVDETVSASDVEIDSVLLWASLAGGYAVVDAPRARVELFAGARYLLLDNDGRSVGSIDASNSKSEDWLDPIVGFDARAELGGRWSAGLLADVGGFGVGSDLSYELLPRISYAWNEILTLNVGYRLLAMDFESSQLDYDVREAGWILGVGFGF
ncbi:MAG TPA: hypothetical protein VF530_13225 [Planctomycetota bacterium]